MVESKFQFVNPYVVEMSYVENKDFKIGEKVQINMDVNTKCRKGKGIGHVELHISTSETSVNSPFEISVRMASDFRWDERLPEETIDSFMKANAPALLLGYARPIIAGVTNASRFPAYNIPFMDFTAQD